MDPKVFIKEHFEHFNIILITIMVIMIIITMMAGGIEGWGAYFAVILTLLVAGVAITGNVLRKYPKLGNSIAPGFSEIFEN